MSDVAVIPTVRLVAGHVELIDQTLLPAEYRVIRLRTVDAVCEAIRALRVRGAPALGIAAAYGLLVSIEERWGNGGYFFDVAADDREATSRVASFPEGVAVGDVVAALESARERLAATRPTAVNLGWALARMRDVWRGVAKDAPARLLLDRLQQEAASIHREDLAMCRRLGEHGAALLAGGGAVLTHCNTGGLATGGLGTALGVVFTAAAAGSAVHVYADETRPLLQGARLTAWECARQGVPVTVLVEGAAASLLASGRVACVVVGADRIAANGDTANKIGTLALAVLAARYGVPFYVAAPSSTIDASLPDGTCIPIEERAPGEVTAFAGTATAPPGAAAYNPAFDVTPADLITAIVTENGVHRPPYAFSMR